MKIEEKDKNFQMISRIKNYYMLVLSSGWWILMIKTHSSLEHLWISLLADNTWCLMGTKISKVDVWSKKWNYMYCWSTI